MTIVGKQLADGQLPNIENDLYVVPAGIRAYVKSIICSNVASGINTVGIFLQPSGGIPRRIAYAAMCSGVTMYYNEATTLDTGDKIRGVATNPSQVDYIISGGEETT